MLTFGLKGPDPWTSLEEWSAILREAGFSWMELRAPEAPDPDWEEQLRAWRERDGWAYSVHARFFGVNLSSPNPKVRRAAVEVALEDLAFATRIGARRLNLHAGDVNWYDVPPPDHPAHARMMEALNRLREQHQVAAALSIAEIAQAARPQGVEVVVENLYKPWELLCSPEEVATFLSRLEGSVGFTLDIGHAALAGRPPVAFLRALDGWVRHLHLHWNDGAFDTHEFPDLSIPDVAEVLQAVKERCPHATLLIEITPCSEDELERFRSWPAQVREMLKAHAG
ncbi:sugar phosphate isomerase/epimerase family protein [Thermoflexus hugenholtzii]